MRWFNTAGPCRPEDHYMLPAEARLEAVRPLLEERAYFTVHAPRQAGKTTGMRSLAESLTAEGRYAALWATCEQAQAVGGDLEAAIPVLIESIESSASLHLPIELRPPSADASVHVGQRLADFLRRWSEACPKPVVLFLDEIDALLDAALISVLRQVRATYPERPEHFPSSVALIGVRDVRDYRLETRPDGASLGTASPFNIKVESIRLPNFTRDDVRQLYEQHTVETGQAFDDEAIERAWQLTQGQPWLVNALARQVVRELVPDRGTSIDAAHVDAAKESLILRRDTHLGSLVSKLREPRVRSVLDAILAGQSLPADVLDDDLSYVEDLGLIAPDPTRLEIANPIYREVIPRTLTATFEREIELPRPSYLDRTGRLDMGALLEDFRTFWKRHAESYLHKSPYSEAAAQLIFMAFLQRVVNGGGSVEREYAVGSGRIDLCVRWPTPEGKVDLHALELKVWRPDRPDPRAEGIEQLAGYLERLGLDRGTLVIFDQRHGAPSSASATEGAWEDVEHRGRRIRILRP